MAFQSLAAILGAPSAPLLLPSLPILFELYMDKGDVVRAAATSACKAILKLFPPESTRIVFRTLEDILDKGKWRTKVGALDAMKSFVTNARDAVAAQLGVTLPRVEAAMHDTKAEVSPYYHHLSSNYSYPVWIGFISRGEMRHCPLHYFGQRRPHSTHSISRQMHV